MLSDAAPRATVPGHPGFPSRTLIAVLGCALPLAAQNWLPTSPYPAWAVNAPTTTVTLTYDPTQSSLANGARLQAALSALQPGHGLAIGPGTWSVQNRLDFSGAGTAQAPFWVFGANPAQKPVITRPDASQNAINVGSVAPARFWALRDLEITGGADLCKLYDCANVWIDSCYLHDGAGVGISAQTIATDHLWLTRNQIARPGPGTNGEAMYLGGGPAVPMSWSAIAFNHVHDTRGALSGQGDGIEIKQGSHHNWVFGNTVHDCKNPCILVYGTAGNAQNVIDGNVCYDSDDVVLQVQGEAIVRNNVAIGGTVAFGSHDHVAASTNLQVVHNTFVSQGRAAMLASWSGRAAMVFANNVAYSLGAESLHFGNGSASVSIAGNVVFGPVYLASAGYVFGTGLADFADVTVATFHTDVTPIAGGAIDNRGNVAFRVALDLEGTVRGLPVDPGALVTANALHSTTAQLSLATGGTQVLAFDAPLLAGAGYLVVGSMSGTAPGVQLGAFTLPLVTDFWLVATLQGTSANLLLNARGTLDPLGRANTTLVLPPLPAVLHGLVLNHALLAFRNGSLVFVSNPVPVTLQ